MTLRGRVFAAACVAILLSLGVGPMARAQTVQYTHDALGRLTNAAYPDGTCLAYTYDAAGNRTQYTSSTIIGVAAPNRTVSTWIAIASTFDPRVGVPTCGPALTVSAVGTPAHGTAAIVSGGTAVTYTPVAGYQGPDSFTYQLLAGGVTSPNGVVNVTVNQPTLAPTALNINAYQSDSVAGYPYVTSDVTSFVSDPYGYTPTISSVTQGSQGTVTVTGNTLTYRSTVYVTKNHSFYDVYTYTVSDGHGNTATATVNVTYEVIPNGPLCGGVPC